MGILLEWKLTSTRGKIEEEEGTKENLLPYIVLELR